LKGDVLEGLLSRSYDSEYYEEKIEASWIDIGETTNLDEVCE
jgi:hypothetical protein